MTEPKAKDSEPTEERTADSESTESAAESQTARQKNSLSSKKEIKDALNQGGGGNKKASSLRKKRLRNDLRAEAYHSARGSSGIPLRAKILIGLAIVTGAMLIYHRGKYTKERRVDNVWTAAEAGNYEAVMRVLNSRPEFVDMADGKGNTLMHYAAMSGNVGICKAIMELRGKFSRLNADRRLPIHYAAEHGSVEVAEILLNRNTVVNLADSDGLQPIHLAARNGHSKIIDLFLEKNPSSLNVNAVCSFRMTALHFAAQVGALDTVKALLKFGTIKLNTLNSHGQSPLAMAVRGGHKEVITALIGAGADPTFAAKGTRSALDFAKESKDPELIALLSAPVVSPNRPARPEIKNGETE